MTYSRQDRRWYIQKTLQSIKSSMTSDRDFQTRYPNAVMQQWHLPDSYSFVVNAASTHGCEYDLVSILVMGEEEGHANPGLLRKQAEMLPIQSATACRCCHALYEGAHIDTPCPNCGSTNYVSAVSEEIVKTLTCSSIGQQTAEMVE